MFFLDLCSLTFSWDEMCTKVLKYAPLLIQRGQSSPLGTRLISLLFHKPLGLQTCCLKIIESSALPFSEVTLPLWRHSNKLCNKLCIWRKPGETSFKVSCLLYFGLGVVQWNISAVNACWGVFMSWFIQETCYF